jgi:hypothetical protein
MKRTSLILIVVLLAAGACSSPDALNGMELRRDGKGPVRVIRDGETISVGTTIGIEAGDVIVTGDNGLATFALEGGEGMRSATLLENSRVLVGSPTEIEADAGHVLLAVKAATDVGFDNVKASATNATFRVDRAFGSTRLGTYLGDVRLDATGQNPVGVASYFQATVVAGDLPPQAIPYQLQLQDVWDQSNLKPQVELEGDLEQLARGFQNQLGSKRPTLAYFGELAGGAPVGFVKSYLRRKPIDLLIGFTVAEKAPGNLEDAFTKAFGYFDEGAKWSIASAILDVKPTPMLAALESLIEGTGVVAAGGATTGSQPEFTLAAAEAANNDSSPVITNPPPDDSEPNPPGEAPKPDQTNQPRECTDSAQCQIQDITDNVPRPGSTPSPSPTSVSDVIDGEL